jgi:hypothetical protein
MFQEKGIKKSWVRKTKLRKIEEKKLLKIPQMLKTIELRK